MPIEGPLRELDIHDLIQLLDLSRKTGALRVTSGVRDNVGTVYFDGGQVVYAMVRSNPHPLGAMLVRSGRITEAELARARATQLERGDGRRLGDILVEQGVLPARELERHLRLQVEAVVFELLSWREGFFSFTEQEVRELPADATVRISAESLLMESARRLDEWGTIADRVPSLDVVPTLAPDDPDAPPLVLAPEEWAVLSAVDGVRDLRAIAASLGRSELDVGKMAARLVKARVLNVAARGPSRPTPAGVAALHAERAAMLLAAGDPEGALAESRQGMDGSCASAHATAARALERLGRPHEALEELRRAARVDADDPEVQRALGYAAARSGELAEAIAAWRGYLRDARAGLARDEAAEALDAAVRLHALLERHDAA